MLTVFANFRINDAERFQRMKDSFDSFCNIEAEWIVNIRGIFSLQSGDYMKSFLGKKCQISHIETNSGWKNDSLFLARKIKSPYVFLWLEDHISLVDPSVIMNVVEEMNSVNVEYLTYSWFFPELNKKWYGEADKISLNSIDYFLWTRTNNKATKINSERPPNIVSLASIFSYSLFEKLLLDKKPYFRRWPKGTPYDFEKNPTDYYLLPFKMAIPRFELFACIDDDNGVAGYSLHARGLYSKRVLRIVALNPKKSVINAFFSNFFPVWLRHFIKRVTYHF